MAQDFRGAFGLGESNRYIDSLDAEGVALAGVQGLYRISRAQQRELVRATRRIERLQAQVAMLERRRG